MGATIARSAHPELGGVIGTHRSHVTGDFLAYYLTAVFGLVSVLAAGWVVPTLCAGNLTAAAGEAAMAALFAWMAFDKVAPWFQRVTTFERGLVWRRLWSEEVVRWDEVRTVFKRVVVDKHDRYEEVVIERVRGGNVTIHSALDGLTRVFDLALERTRQPILRRALGDLEAGRSCDFGAVRATRNGLAREGEHLPWGCVSAVLVRGGRLVVEVDGGTAPVWAVDLDDIDNPDTLCAVARAMQGRT